MVQRYGTQVWYEGMVYRYGTHVWYTGMVHRYGGQVWYEGMVHRYGTKVWYTGVVRRYGGQVWYEGMVRRYGGQVWYEGMVERCRGISETAFQSPCLRDASLPTSHGSLVGLEERRSGRPQAGRVPLFSSSSGFSVRPHYPREVRVLSTHGCVERHCAGQASTDRHVQPHRSRVPQPHATCHEVTGALCRGWGERVFRWVVQPAHCAGHNRTKITKKRPMHAYLRSELFRA